jgi:hypothetical protein
MWYKEGGASAYLSTFICNPFVGGRGEFKSGARNARPCRYLYNANIHPFGQILFKTGISTVSSKGLTHLEISY